MMSMWSVPDRETQELMTLFHAKWRGGLDKPEALQQAQLRERETVRQRYGKIFPSTGAHVSPFASKQPGRRPGQMAQSLI